jgi:ribosomal-protein-alanine N-acetyltransferase
MSFVQHTAAAADRASMHLLRMRPADLDEVVHVEYAIYPFPWTRGNFMDSIQSGYETWIVRDGSGTLAGYFLMMPAVDEAHLLNITVSAEFQRQGIGRLLLDKVIELARAKGLRSILLEVRPSNTHALAVYRHCGFAEIGLRRNYYPAPAGKREDAIVMRLPI